MDFIRYWKALAALCVVLGAAVFMFATSGGADDVRGEAVDVAAALGVSPKLSPDVPLRGSKLARDVLGVELYEQNGQIVLGRAAIPFPQDGAGRALSLTTGAVVQNIRIWSDARDTEVGACDRFACLDELLAQATPGEDRIQFGMGQAIPLPQPPEGALWVETQDGFVIMEDGQPNPAYWAAYGTLLHTGLGLQPAPGFSDAVSFEYARIATVAPGSPAARAGIAPGEHFTIVDGGATGSLLGAVNGIFGLHRQQKAIRIAYEKDDDPFNIDEEVTLIPGPAAHIDGQTISFPVETRPPNPFAGKDSDFFLLWEERPDLIFSFDKPRMVAAFIGATSLMVTPPPPGATRVDDYGCGSLPSTEWTFTQAFLDVADEPFITERKLRYLSVFNPYVESIMLSYNGKPGARRAALDFLAEFGCDSPEFEALQTKILDLAATL